MTVATWPQQWERSLARLDFKPRCLWPYYLKKKKGQKGKEKNKNTNHIIQESQRRQCCFNANARINYVIFMLNNS